MYVGAISSWQTRPTELVAPGYLFCDISGSRIITLSHHNPTILKRSCTVSVRRSKPANSLFHFYLGRTTWPTSSPSHCPLPKSCPFAGNWVSKSLACDTASHTAGSYTAPAAANENVVKKRKCSSSNTQQDTFVEQHLQLFI